MSYSFVVMAENKADAKANVVQQFATVVAGFPAHAKDESAVIALANAFIDLVPDDDTMNVQLHIYGSLSITGDDSLAGVGANVSAYLAAKPAQATANHAHAVNDPGHTHSLT
jgi:hypothetical protein